MDSNRNNDISQKMYSNESGRNACFILDYILWQEFFYIRETEDMNAETLGLTPCIITGVNVLYFLMFLYNNLYWH